MLVAVPNKPAKIVECHLKRQKALGMVWDHSTPPPKDIANTIYIDPRQSERSYFGTLIHELMHIAMPPITEPFVLSLEKYIATSLWAAGYRKLSREEIDLIKKHRTE